jgi:hypothetical protein
MQIIFTEFWWGNLHKWQLGRLEGPSRMALKLEGLETDETVSRLCLAITALNLQVFLPVS